MSERQVYKNRIIDKFVNKFEIFFPNGKLYTLNFLILLHQQLLHHR